MNKAPFRTVMEQFNLQPRETLDFIDQYPRVRVPLRQHFPEAIETHDLIAELKDKFEG